MMLFKLDEEVTPILEKCIGDIDPQTLNTNVVDAFAPDVRALPATTKKLHALSHADIFAAMIAPTSAGYAMCIGRLFEKLKYRRGSIVAAGSNASDKARIAIYKAMNNNLPSNKFYVVSDWCASLHQSDRRSENVKVTYHVVHRDARARSDLQRGMSAWQSPCEQSEQVLLGHGARKYEGAGP
jgi:hypothetical protein